MKLKGVAEIEFKKMEGEIKRTVVAVPGKERKFAETIENAAQSQIAKERSAILSRLDQIKRPAPKQVKERVKVKEKPGLEL